MDRLFTCTKLFATKCWRMTKSSQAFKSRPGRAADRRSERRQVAVLRAALIDIGGLPHFCRVVNVSEHGLELRLYRSAKRGETVKIHLPSGNCLSGAIVWSRGNCAGIKLDRLLDTCAFTATGRTDPRYRRRMPRAGIEVPAALRIAHATYPATIFDISPAGARVRLKRELQHPGPALLRLTGIGDIHARICWVDGAEVGLSFNAPIEMQLLERWLDGARVKIAYRELASA